MSTIRTFVGAHIPETPELRHLLRRLQRIDGLPRTVATDGMHITLKFLGDVESDQVDTIAAAARESAGLQKSSEIRLRGVGAFPNLRRPSVIWVGLQQAEFLATIAADLETRLEALGFPRDPRPFQPHVTLLRIKSRPPEELFELLQASLDLGLGAVRVDAITFYQSELRPEGSRYTKLATCPLQ